MFISRKPIHACLGMFTLIRISLPIQVVPWHETQKADTSKSETETSLGINGCISRRASSLQPTSTWKSIADISRQDHKDLCSKPPIQRLPKHPSTHKSQTKNTNYVLQFTLSFTSCWITFLQQKAAPLISWTIIQQEVNPKMFKKKLFGIHFLLIHVDTKFNLQPPNLHRFGGFTNGFVGHCKALSICSAKDLATFSGRRPSGLSVTRPWVDANGLNHHAETNRKIGPWK